MRDTWIERVTQYLAACQGHYSPVTLARIKRNLETIRKDLRDLDDNPDASRRPKVAPTKVREEHISDLLLVWRSRKNRRDPSKVGVDLATQRKYLSDLEGFLVWNHNTVLDMMRRMRHVHLPKAVEQEPESLDDVCRLLPMPAHFDAQALVNVVEAFVPHILGAGLVRLVEPCRVLRLRLLAHMCLLCLAVHSDT